MSAKKSPGNLSDGNPQNLLANVRRRVWPAASAMAMLSLTGCGGANILHPHAAAEAEPIAPSTQDQVAARVKDYTSGLDAALDKVDQERLRAAAEKKAALTPQVVLANAQSSAPVQADAPARVEIPVSTEVPVITKAVVPPVTPAAKPDFKSSSIVKVTVNPTPTPAVAPTPTPVTIPAPAPAVAVAPTPTIAPTPVPAVAAKPIQKAAPDIAVESIGTAPVPSATIATISQPLAANPTAMGMMTAMVMPPTVGTSPVTSVQNAPTEPSIDDALQVLRKHIAVHPTLNTTLAMALLETSEGKAPSVDPAKTLSGADQKLFTDLLSALQGFGAPAPTATISDRAAPLVDAAKKWQADADLALPKLVLASRVDSFGVYTPVDSKFTGGQKHTVIIYCEVANFTAKKTDDGWFETHLAQQETLITDDGLLVWRPNAEEIEDRSMNHRHDFYLVKKLTIPENLAIGKYTLRMNVTDKNSGKIALVSLPVEIVEGK